MSITSIRTTSPEVTPNTRAERALTFFEERGREIERVAPDVYLVPSCTGTGVYRVRYGAQESCECPDFEFGHGERACKHLLSVGILNARRRSGIKVISTFAAAAGDPFKAASKGALEERLAHDLLDDEERQELRDRVIRSRRSL